MVKNAPGANKCFSIQLHIFPPPKTRPSSFPDPARCSALCGCLRLLLRFCLCASCWLTDVCSVDVVILLDAIDPTSESYSDDSISEDSSPGLPPWW